MYTLLTTFCINFTLYLRSSEASAATVEGNLSIWNQDESTSNIIYEHDMNTLEDKIHPYK